MTSGQRVSPILGSFPYHLYCRPKIDSTIRSLKAPCSPQTYSAHTFLMTFQRLECSASIFKPMGKICPKAKVGGGANSWRPKMETCLAGYNTCTCSWCCTVCFYKTDHSQHGTPAKSSLNAGAALELMAITASAPGQRLTLTHPLFALSMRAYWNDWKSCSVHVQIQETWNIYPMQFQC